MIDAPFRGYSEPQPLTREVFAEAVERALSAPVPDPRQQVVYLSRADVDAMTESEWRAWNLSYCVVVHP